MTLHPARGALACAALILSGCASLSPDGGFGTVEQLSRERTGQTPNYQRNASDVDSAKARVKELLAQPLSADRAVEIAMLNHRGLQASLAELGIAESALVRAGRLGNPSFSFGRLGGSGGVEIERAVIFDVLGLFAMPTAIRVERSRFEQAQLRAAYEVVGAAAEARRAFYGAVAAQQLLGYAGQVQEAADASGELARRMLQAGNFSKLAQMREQAFEANALLQMTRARHRSVAERERLVRALGIAGDPAELQLPERLPDLPAEPVEPRDAERTAMDKRLDVLMAKRSNDAVAQSLGLTRSTRFVNVLEAGYQNKSSDEGRANGFEIELQLPLFDFGSARVARAESTYMQSVHRTAQVAVEARSEVRETWSAYRSAYDLAKHYRDEIVPLRKRISQENLLRYNGMLSSVFELLADSREQIDSVTGYVEALRGFWVADTDLHTALTGRSPGGASFHGSSSDLSSPGTARDPSTQAAH